MPKIKLTILASDIREADYTDPSDCSITRALHRAGYKELHDCICILNEHNRVIIPFENITYIPLYRRVTSMYSYEGEWDPQHYHNSTESIVPIPAEDFEHTLIY